MKTLKNISLARARRLNFSAMRITAVAYKSDRTAPVNSHPMWANNTGIDINSLHPHASIAIIVLFKLFPLHKNNLTFLKLITFQPQLPSLICITQAVEFNSILIMKKSLQ